MVVHEYARLTTAEVVASTNQATITQSAFDWLCRLGSQFRATGAELLHVNDRYLLKLDNFVGVLETPCGTTIEILPKNHGSGDDVQKSRSLLCRMIQAALDLPTRHVGPADVSIFKGPVSEWVMQQFLACLEHLATRGLRFDYLRIQDEQPYLRGQLDVVRQLRQPPGREHYFQLRHDVYLPDRPENRLIKTALDMVCKRATNPGTWRLAHELRGLLAEIPYSVDPARDFKAWRNDRLLAHYRPIRKWCELILRQHMPMAVSGDWHGLSLLFPMERLFERFVEAALRRDLGKDVVFTSQSRQQHLCTHQGEGFFQLRPDFLMRRGGKRWVLDAKWKILDQKARGKKYGLSQSDFYQLFAYAHKYLDQKEGGQELVLIYPRTASFTEPLPAFKFNDSMTMWVLPFDMGEYAGSERLHVPEQLALAAFFEGVVAKQAA